MKKIIETETSISLIPTDESKGKFEKYGKIWSKIKDLLISKNNNSDYLDKTYMKIKFNSDDDFPLKKALELHNIRINVRSVFNDSCRYYTKIF